MQIVIFPQEDGSAAIMVPAPEYADQIEVVADRDVPAGTVWRIIDDSELPPCADGYRWMWTDSGPLTVEPEPEIGA